MGRWFRRQDKDRKKGREESEAPPPEEVPALESGGAGSSPPEPAEDVAAGFKPAVATPIEEAAEEPEAEGEEPHRGRFRRLRERLGRTREAL
ncbi:MAG: hypothetical protein WCF59_07995, partial [Desulfobaccales bacterium]